MVINHTATWLQKIVGAHEPNTSYRLYEFKQKLRSLSIRI